MAGSEAAGLKIVMDFILDNMSSRMADQLREEIAELETVKASEAELAMSAIIDVIRQLETDGELQLVQDDEEED